MNLRVLVTATALLLTACQPADQKVKSVKERLEAGEVVEFTKPGYRRPSCSSRQPDWTDVRLSDEAERERIITKAQASSLNPGKHSCFRVGSVIDLNSPQKNSNAGKVRITKISIVQLDKLTSRNLKGTYFAKADDFGRYKDAAKFRLKPEHEGIVTIVDFQYIADSAPDEKLIKEKVKREAEGDGLSQTMNDGDFISSCNAPWTELLAADAFHEPLLSGKLRSFYRIGDLNCLKQGQIVELKAKRGDPSKGMMKILKIKKFRMAHLSEKYFEMGEYPYADLERTIKAERANEWMTVMIVEPAAAAIMGGK